MEGGPRMIQKTEDDGINMAVINLVKNWGGVQLSNSKRSMKYVTKLSSEGLHKDNLIVWTNSRT